MSVVDDRAYWIDNSQMYGTLQQLSGSFVKLESTDKCYPYWLVNSRM